MLATVIVPRSVASPRGAAGVGEAPAGRVSQERLGQRLVVHVGADQVAFRDGPDGWTLEGIR